MEARNVRNNRIFAVTFLVMLISITLVSNYKLIKYYINDEVVNNEWNASTDSKFETDLISNFGGKFQYVNFNGFMRSLLGQREMNGVIKMNNGRLIMPSDYVEDDKIEEYAGKVALFSNYIQKKNKRFVFVIPPCGADKYDNQIPIGINVNTNENLDRMSAELKSRNVEVLDLRDEIKEQGISSYDIFFKTDHHWTPKGGFFAFNLIMKYLAETSNIEPNEDIMNLDNYDTITYKKWHLGSSGQRVGKYYGGIDDFDLILPKFDVCIENYDTKDIGSYESMMINTYSLNNVNYTSRYTYDSVYSSLKNWYNPNATIKENVLMISDSMNRVVEPYMVFSFERVFFLDDLKTSSLTEELYKEYNPDIVLCMYYNGAFNDVSYDFFTNEGENE